MLPESADEVVDSSVGMGRNEDRVGDLPVMFEEFDRLDDDAGLACPRWLNVSYSSEHEVFTAHTLDQAQPLAQHHGDSAYLGRIERDLRIAFDAHG